MKRRHRKLSIERAEERRLLAADLLVEHDPISDESSNDQVTRVIRVHNIGDEVAEQVLVRSSLTDELVDPIWERYQAPAKFIEDPTRGRSPDFRISGGTIVQSETIGDVNGDGLRDMLFHWGTDERHGGRISWGEAKSSVVFGGVTSDFDLANPEPNGFRIISTSGDLVIWSDPFQTLGDINNDGSDDIAFADRVILGGPTIGSDGAINVARLSPEEGFVVAQGATQVDAMFGVGDANADGIDDFVVQGSNPQIVWGDDELEGTETLDTATGVVESANVTCGNLCEGTRVSNASPAGDINNDGFQDFVLSWGEGHVGLRSSGTAVVYGGPHLAAPSIVLGPENGVDGFLIETESTGFRRLQLGFDVEAETLSGEVRSSPAGDVDGDGVDDLLMSYLGGRCHGCTATDKSELEVAGGAVVLFGGTDIAIDGTFDPQRDRLVRFEVTVDYFEQRPRAVASDTNGDGLNDIEIATGELSYLIQGARGMSSYDLGFGGAYPHPEKFLDLNGESYGQLGNRIRLDVDGDGHVDEVVITHERHANVFLYSAEEHSFVVGSGDVSEVLDIAPGASMVYVARGSVRSDATPISTTAVAASVQGGEDLRDNLVSNKEGVLLQVELTIPNIVAEGEQVELELRVANSGPQNAQGAIVHETVSDGLVDVRWTRTDTAFPAVVQLEHLRGADGAKFVGPRRVREHFRPLPADYEGPKVSSLGLRVGSLGDVDDDGFDDFFGEGDGRQAVVFRGGPDFNANGLFPQHTNITKLVEDESALLADFNGDGFLDQITGDELVRDTRGETYVVFGAPSGIPALEPTDLDGENGIVIIGDRVGDFSGFSLAAGDVNADGFEDVIVGSGSNGQGRCCRGPIQEQPRIHVVFGSALPGPSIRLDSLDGTNGFRIEAVQLADPDNHTPRQTAVASDLDINGDGVDDILIGDSQVGARLAGAPGYIGGLYVVFGRKQQNQSGTGAVADTVDIPTGGEVTYLVRGTIPESFSYRGNVSVTEGPTQINLDPRSSKITIPASQVTRGDVDSNGIVDFADFLLLAENFGNTAAKRDQGDLDENGVVDFNDFAILQETFGARS